MHDASSCTTPSAFGNPLQPTPVWFGSSSTIATPATSASRTSAPSVIILNAFATQVTPCSSFDRLPFEEATTHGCTLLGVIIVGAWPNTVVGTAAAAAAAPVVWTNCRRLILVTASSNSFRSLSRERRRATRSVGRHSPEVDSRQLGQGALSVDRREKFQSSGIIRRVVQPERLVPVRDQRHHTVEPERTLGLDDADAAVPGAVVMVVPDEGFPRRRISELARTGIAFPRVPAAAMDEIGHRRRGSVPALEIQWPQPESRVANRERFAGRIDRQLLRAVDIEQRGALGDNRIASPSGAVKVPTKSPALVTAAGDTTAGAAGSGSPRAAAPTTEIAYSATGFGRKPCIALIDA